MRASQSSGIASAIASGSAFCSATAFGTSSPSTTERYVRIANEIRKATVFESGGSMSPESSGSPMAPSRIAKIVIPTCTVEMNRTGSSMRRSAVFAPRPPRSARSSRRDRRPVIRAYSAATKTAFPRTRRNTMTSLREVLMGWFPPMSGPRGRQRSTGERCSRPVRGAGTRRDFVAHDDQAAV